LACGLDPGYKDICFACDGYSANSTGSLNPSDIYINGYFYYADICKWRTRKREEAKHFLGHFKVA
jgi:hypothetical protein